MAAAPDVAVVVTGTANLASILAGLHRAGARALTTTDIEAVIRASHLVLPGVGAFAAAMERLRADGLAEAIAARVRFGRPTLTVCLGLQLMLDGSDESPDVEGLCVVPGHATRFDGDVRVPQLGWNKVEPAGGRLVEPGYAYFAHSYRLTDAPEGWDVAWTDHGGRYVSALERDGVLACQFHPELSGAWGLRLLRRWLAC